MSRFIEYLNLFGIAALVALCCVQWRINRRSNLQAIDLESTRLEQQAKIAEQEKTLKGNAADLDDFRQRLMLSESALKESGDKFAAVAAERDKLLAEREQFKTALNQWIAAVSARDDALKQANDQLQKMIDQRNSAVSKFNDLAEKYNDLVKQLPGQKMK